MRAIRTKVPKACQRLIFTCQRANKRVNVSKACQRRASFSSWPANVAKASHFFQLRLPKGVPTSQLFFKRIIFFICKIYLCLAYFIYFVYLKDISNTYFLDEYIFLPKFIRRI